MDKEKIFTGTLLKRFTHARQNLESNYSYETAEAFSEVYKCAPLSFILFHSREIFSDSYLGKDFYRKVMLNSIIDPVTYVTEIGKLEVFIGEAAKRGMSKTQLDSFATLFGELKNVQERMGGLSDVFKAIYASDGGAAYVATILEELYHLGCCDCCCDENDHDKKLGIDTIANSIFTSKNMYVAFGMGVLLVDKYPQYAGLLMDLTDRCLRTSEDVDADMYRRHRMGIAIVQRLMTSSYVTDILKKVGNMRLSTLWFRVANTELDKAAPMPVVEEAHDDMYKFTPSADATNIADLRMFIESYDENPNIMQEKYDYYKFKAARLSSEIECMEYLRPNTLPVVYEGVEDLESHAEATFLALEWEDDGSPNSVIQRHIMTSKEKAEQKEAEDAKRHTPINVHSEKLDQDNEEADKENEICKKLEAAIDKVENINPGEEAVGKEILASARKVAIDAKKEIGENSYAKARALLTRLINEIADNDEQISEASEELDGELQMFLESDGLKEELKDAPGAETTGKPKQDLATKVQNKALDSAAKSSQKYAERKEAEQKIKNAGMALSENPKRVGADLKGFIAKFDKWDDNRRKEFLLKPGFRHKLWKRFRTCLLYGAVAQVKLAWLPMLALFRHCSKIKDKRIRDELSRELEAEIKICDEKISDANAKGDNSSKYELMRIKERLEAERIRVRTNSKYV